MFRKPLSGTVAANFMAHGTGALNIDAARVYTDWNEADRSDAWKASGHSAKPDAEKIAAPPGEGIDLHPGGRWPPNVLLSHADGCELAGARIVKRKLLDASSSVSDGSTFGTTGGSRSLGTAAESVADWRCVPGCPVAELDAQSGKLQSGTGAVKRATGAGYQPNALGAESRSVGAEMLSYGDTGTASRFFPQFETEARFFYTAKASRSERDAGLDDFEPKSGAEATASKDGQARLESPRSGSGRHGGSRNIHPTVKPVDLMRWLVRLVGRKDALILDPFAGSGTTGVAAMLEGMRFVGLELEPLYVDFARARIAHVIGGTWEREVKPERPVEKKQPGLFDAIGAGK